MTNHMQPFYHICLENRYIAISNLNVINAVTTGDFTSDITVAEVITLVKLVLHHSNLKITMIVQTIKHIARIPFTGI